MDALAGITLHDGRTGMSWTLDDGGRKAAGFHGPANDCVCRAIAVATRMPYREVYDRLNALGQLERKTKRRRRSAARTGVHRRTYERLLSELGWRWVGTRPMFGGAVTFLCREDLPPGRLIVSVSKHLTCVIDHVIYDTHDPQRATPTLVNGLPRISRRQVYGYYTRENDH